MRQVVKAGLAVAGVAATMGSLALPTAIAAPAGPIASSPTAPPGTFVSSAGAISFWTAARTRQARALTAAPGPAAGPDLATPDRARPGQVPPLSPAGASASSAFDPVADPEAPGNRESGAIFVALAHHLGVARCSGTSVSAGNRSLVFTAGHCVYDGGPRGRWLAGKWVFIPGYHNGERPFGVFPAKWLGTTKPWQQHGSENGDVGVAVVGRNERGQLLADAVGAAGIAWGLPPQQSFDIHGYPVAPPYNGSDQRLCAATPFLGHDFGSFLWHGPLNLAVDCPVTGGASGGGWLIDGNTIDSVTDYGYPDDPRTDYGPYFGSAVHDLYRRAAKIK